MKLGTRAFLMAIVLSPASLTAQGPADPRATAPAPGAVREGPLKLAPQPTQPAISAADLRTRVYIYADDSMMGRESGTPGSTKATDYIASELKRLGLEPAGDSGTYFQNLPLVARAVDPGATLATKDGALRLDVDYTPLRQVGFFPFGPTLVVTDAPVIYGGRVGDPSATLTAEQVAGKIVVLFPALGPNGPEFQFWARGGLDRYAGAAAVAIATQDISPPPFLEFMRAPQERMVGPDEPSGAGRPLGLLITSATAARLLGPSLDSLTVGAAGVTVAGNVRFREIPVAHPARNVVAILRGRDRKLRGQYVAIGAHNDHVGTASRALDHDSLRAFNAVMKPAGADSPNAVPTAAQAATIATMIDSLRALRPARLDSVFNGADDDASGSMAVLEIAQAMAAARSRPRRSVLFVWHAAEEKGLYGAAWFTDQPTVPRDSIVAQLNLDMVGRGAASDLVNGGPGYLQLIGSRRLSTELGDLVETANSTGRHGFSFDYQYDADGHPANYYCRSDHYMYARYGIPVTFFSTGGHRDYHQLTDEPQYLDYDQLARVALLVKDIAQRVADREQRLVVDKPKPDPKGDCQQ